LIVGLGYNKVSSINAFSAVIGAAILLLSAVISFASGFLAHGQKMARLLTFPE